MLLARDFPGCTEEANNDSEPEDFLVPSINLCNKWSKLAVLSLSALNSVKISSILKALKD